MPVDEAYASDPDHASDCAESEEDIDTNCAVIAYDARVQSEDKEDIPFSLSIPLLPGANYKISSELNSFCTANGERATRGREPSSTSPGSFL